ncbi:MAG: hypothetical protein AAGI15_15565 [Pseudomonadota bacterium]
MSDRKRDTANSGAPLKPPAFYLMIAVPLAAVLMGFGMLTISLSRAPQPIPAAQTTDSALAPLSKTSWRGEQAP